VRVFVCVSERDRATERERERACVFSEFCFCVLRVTHTHTHTHTHTSFDICVHEFAIGGVHARFPVACTALAPVLYTYACFGNFFCVCAASLQRMQRSY
jgi:hypothetical protein